MASILPMVDLLGNTAVDWFCILSYFRLDTLLMYILFIFFETLIEISRKYIIVANSATSKGMAKKKVHK